MSNENKVNLTSDTIVTHIESCTATKGSNEVPEGATGIVCFNAKGEQIAVFVFTQNSQIENLIEIIRDFKKKHFSVGH